VLALTEKLLGFDQAHDSDDDGPASTQDQARETKAAVQVS
jgi:hypothetical protein